MSETLKNKAAVIHTIYGKKIGGLLNNYPTAIDVKITENSSGKTFIIPWTSIRKMRVK